MATSSGWRVWRWTGRLAAKILAQDEMTQRRRMCLGLTLAVLVLMLDRISKTAVMAGKWGAEAAV